MTRGLWVGMSPAPAASWGAANPMTTVGDMLVGGAAGVPTRLAAGTNGYVLTLAAGVPTWSVSASGGFSNPMTTVGDLIVGGTSGAAGRLAASTSGFVLTSNGAGVAPSWQASTGVVLGAVNVYTKNQSVAPFTNATATGTQTPDASVSNNFQYTLTGSVTIANPTNLTSGMVLNFCLDEDATGGRTISFGTLYKWPGGTVPSWVTTANAKNFFSAYYDGTVLRCGGAGGYA